MRLSTLHESSDPREYLLEIIAKQLPKYNYSISQLVKNGMPLSNILTHINNKHNLGSYDWGELKKGLTSALTRIDLPITIDKAREILGLGSRSTINTLYTKIGGSRQALSQLVAGSKVSTQKDKV